MFRVLLYLSLIIFVPCNCQEESVRKLLRKEGIIPRIVTSAPEPVCKVVFQHKYEIVPGQEYTQSVILREPKVTWETENNTFYTLYMFGISDTQFGYLQFVNVDDKQPGIPRTQWNHWLVINIPGAAVHRGRVIYKWLEIEPPNTIKIKVWYMFVIFKQPDLLVFNDNMPERHYKVMKNETNPFSPITDFMNWFQLKYEHMVACNFFIHRDERPTSSTINPTDLDLLWVIKCGKFAQVNTTVRTTTLRAQYINVIRPDEIAVK